MRAGWLTRMGWILLQDGPSVVQIRYIHCKDGCWDVNCAPYHCIVLALRLRLAACNDTRLDHTAVGTPDILQAQLQIADGESTLPLRKCTLVHGQKVLATPSSQR